jgi:hypothetical protein
MYTESGSGYNNAVIVWDYRRNAISLYDNVDGTVMLDYKTVQLFGTSETSTGILRQIGGLNDGGTAIDIECQFPWWDMGNDRFLRFQHMNVDTTIQGLHSASVTIEMDDESISKALEAYANENAEAASATATVFTATSVSATEAWNLSTVVEGMWAYVDATKFGAITAIDDGNDILTVDDWDGGGGTPSNGETVTIRGKSWGSNAWVQDGSSYRVTKAIDMIDSDSVKLYGRQIRLKITHSGLSQPITVHGIEVFFKLTNKINKLPEVIVAEGYDTNGDAI